MSNEELAIRAQGGDVDALLLLWNQTKGFAAWIARRWDNGGVVDTDDLSQAGFLALVDAVSRYDSSAGAFLPLYANRLRTEFRVAKFGGRGKRCEFDPIHRATSLNTPIGDDEDGEEYADCFPDESAARSFDELEQEELSEAVRNALDALDGAERQVICCRYYAALPREKTAQTLKISVSEAQKLEASALRKLRNPSISRYLRTFL